jgi:ABC-type transport system involved in cytochrome c biogenesis permease subunit
MLDTLEGMIFRVIDLGFPFLTVGLACGSIWASISWGRFWNWDAKEVWALTTWLIYAGCLHLRHTRNLRGINAALLALIGFFVILFTYIGVNLFFSTIHSYA